MFQGHEEPAQEHLWQDDDGHELNGLELRAGKCAGHESERYADDGACRSVEDNPSGIALGLHSEEAVADCA